MGERESKRNIAIGCLLFLCFIIVGVAFKLLVYPQLQDSLMETTGSQSQYTHEVRLRLDSFSGYAAFRSAAFADALKAQGIKLALQDDQADYQARLKSLARDQADMAVFTIDAYIAAGARASSYPATIVAVVDETWGADAVVAYKSAVPDLQALNNPDARLVLTPDSPSEFLARVAIAEFGLGQLSTRWQERDGAADVLAAMQKAPRSKLQGYVLWEPYKAQALEDSAVTVLFDSSRLSGYIVDVLVARRQFLVDYPQVVQAVVEAMLRTLYSYDQQRGGMVDLVREDAEKLGDPLSEPLAAKVVDGIRWRNTLENYAHFGLVSAEQAGGVVHLEDSITNIAGVLVRTGALAENPVVDTAHELFYKGILEAMMAADFHPGGLGIVSGGMGTADLEQIRGVSELPALNDDEWDRLTPVGSIQVKPISFGRGTARLHVQGQRELDDLARRLHSLPNFYLTVWGHTRAEGDADANRALAEQRADAAMQALIAKGISRNRVRALAAPMDGSSGDRQSVSFALSQQPY